MFTVLAGNYIIRARFFDFFHAELSVHNVVLYILICLFSLLQRTYLLQQPLHVVIYFYYLLIDIKYYYKISNYQTNFIFSYLLHKTKLLELHVRLNQLIKSY